MLRDHLKLQLIILLWGFTAVLGAKISLPASELVVFRTALAGLVLWGMLRKRIQIQRKDAFSFFATGWVIGIHWVSFFLAVKVANVSICMIGLATLSLWTALLEPIFRKEKKFSALDLFFGIIVMGGVVLIFQSEIRYGYGLVIALISAIMGALFSVLNAFHVKKAHHEVITFYEMLGALALAGLALPFMGETLRIPTWSDWGYLLILSVFCTVVAFSYYVELLNRLSVFTINFANNLEPVYGILLAAWLLGDSEHLTPGFYQGAVIILGATVLYPLIKRRLKDEAKI